MTEKVLPKSTFSYLCKLSRRHVVGNGRDRSLHLLSLTDVFVIL